MSKPARRAVELNILKEEHSRIHCRYAELDDVILQAQGSPRIIEAARELVGMLLLHFSHEEEFLEKIPVSGLEEQRRAGKKMTDEILRIEAGLRMQEADAALRLRGLCKGWMYKHMSMDGLEFEITAARMGGYEPRGVRAQGARLPL
jgi:hemerythrin